MAPDRKDPELGLVRRCSTCHEEFPLDAGFFRRYQKRSGVQVFRRQCRACQADVKNGRPIPLRPVTHGDHIDWDAKRVRDLERKAELRRDPILGDKLRNRQREASARYFARNQAQVRANRRVAYAAALDRPVQVGVGRPRIK